MSLLARNYLEVQEAKNVAARPHRVAKDTCPQARAVTIGQSIDHKRVIQVPPPPPPRLPKAPSGVSRVVARVPPGESLGLVKSEGSRSA